jgi:hypothetical protein
MTCCAEASTEILEKCNAATQTEHQVVGEDTTAEIKGIKVTEEVTDKFCSNRE